MYFYVTVDIAICYCLVQKSSKAFVFVVRLNTVKHKVEITTTNTVVLKENTKLRQDHYFLNAARIGSSLNIHFCLKFKFIK